MSKTYDNLQRLRSLHYGEAHRDWGMSFVYNLGNQLTTSSRFDGTFWTYDYDALGQVAQARKHLGSTVIPGYEFDYAYDDIGNRTSAMRDNSATRKQLYYSAVSAGGTAGANVLNQYGSRTTPRILGVMGKAHESAAITVNTQTATRTGEHWQALLDYAGEPSPNAPRWAILALDASLYMGGGNTAYAKLTEKAELPPNPENFTYDADGNLATDWRWTYTWNAENRLVALEPSSVAVALGLPEEKITYAYDSQGRRFQREVIPWDTLANDWDDNNPTQVTLYLYDDWNLIYEADLSVPSNPQSALTDPQSYAWGLDLSGSFQGAGGVGGLLAVADDSGDVYYPVYDHIGNVRAYIDGVTADVVAEFEYSPFGETLQASGSKVNQFAFRFSTKHQDSTSGLYYYGYRWYDAELGRWLNRDPIEESGGSNLYAFISNNGVNRWDYLGLRLDAFPANPRSVKQLPAGGRKGGQVKPNWPNKIGTCEGAKLTIQGSISYDIYFEAGKDPHKVITDDGRILFQHEMVHVTYLRAWWNDLKRSVDRSEGEYSCSDCCDIAARVVNAILEHNVWSESANSSQFDVAVYRYRDPSRQVALNRAAQQVSYWRNQISDLEQEYRDEKCEKIN